MHKDFQLFAQNQLAFKNSVKRKLVCITKPFLSMNLIKLRLLEAADGSLKQSFYCNILKYNASIGKIVHSA